MFPASGLKWVLRHQVFMLLVFVATLGATVLLYRYVPKGFFPQQDTGTLMGVTEASQDISFPAMVELQRQVLAIVMSDPAVATVASFVSGSGNSVVNNGRMFITLKPIEEGRVRADQVLSSFRSLDWSEY